MNPAAHPLTELVTGGIEDWVLVDERGYDPDLGTWLRNFRGSVATLKQIRSGNIQALFRQTGDNTLPLFTGNILVVDHPDCPNENIPLIQYFGLDHLLLEAARNINTASCPHCRGFVTRATVDEILNLLEASFSDQLVSIIGADNSPIDEVRVTLANKLRLHDSLALGLDSAEGTVHIRSQSGQELLCSRALGCKECGYSATPLLLKGLREEFAATDEGFWNKTAPFQATLTTLRRDLAAIGLDHVVASSRINSLSPADRLRLHLMKILPTLEPETLLVLDTPTAWLVEDSTQKLLRWLESRARRLLVIDNRTRYANWPGRVVAQNTTDTWTPTEDTPPSEPACISHQPRREMGQVDEDARNFGKSGRSWAEAQRGRTFQNDEADLPLAPSEQRAGENCRLIISPLLGAAEGQKTVARLCGLEKPLAEFFAKLPVSLVRGYSAKDFQDSSREGLSDVTFKHLSFSEILGLSVGLAREQLLNVPPVAKVLNILVDFDLGQLTLNLPGSSLRKAEVMRLRLAKLLIRPPKDIAIVVAQCQLLNTKIKNRLEDRLIGRKCSLIGTV